MNLRKFVLFAVLALGIADSALDPEADPVGVKSVSAEYQKARSTLKIECRLSIPRPWHVNSDSLKQDYLIPTGLVLADTALGRRVKKKYPKPVLRTVFGQELSLFEGNLEFTNFFYLVKPPVFPLQVILQYQSCSDQICLPPVFKKLTLTRAGGKIRVVY